MSNAPVPTSTPPQEPNKFHALMRSLAEAFSLDSALEDIKDLFDVGSEITIPAITKSVDIAVTDDITLVASGHVAEIKAAVKSSTAVNGNASSQGGFLKKVFAPVPAEKPDDTE